MPAEEIAKVVRDMQRGNVSRRDIGSFLPETDSERFWFSHVPVVDVTTVYERFMADPAGKDAYEDHVAAPPWVHALLGYVNSVGNVTVIDYSTVEILDEDDKARVKPWQPGPDKWHIEGPYEPIEWERVRWMTTAFVYAGGRYSSGVPVATQGPLHLWRIPIYPDGIIADIQWNQLVKELDHEVFGNAMMTMLDTLTMCNCVNVAIAEPERERKERRRLERTGVQVSEIHIRPVSKSYRGKGTPLSSLPMSAHSVRGHYSNYGPKYGRGLLFGRHEGRYWIPPHVRGSADVGEVEQSYVVEAVLPSAAPDD